MVALSRSSHDYQQRRLCGQDEQDYRFPDSQVTLLYFVFCCDFCFLFCRFSAFALQLLYLLHLFCLFFSPFVCLFVCLFFFSTSGSFFICSSFFAFSFFCPSLVRFLYFSSLLLLSHPLLLISFAFAFAVALIFVTVSCSFIFRFYCFSFKLSVLTFVSLCFECVALCYSVLSSCLLLLLLLLLCCAVLRCFGLVWVGIL